MKKLCLFKKVEIPEDELWLDKLPYGDYTRWQIVAVLYDHPHNDIENGQPETHYHVDTRYARDTDYGGVGIRIDLPLQEGYRLDYVDEANLKLDQLHVEEQASTALIFIMNSTLKRKCIHKGKCPHRGFDLSNVAPDENGIIKCPLHSLRFNAKTGKMIIPKLYQ